MVASLTIIVPVYNEERYVGGVLKELDGLDLPVDVEIVAVDDCSTDNSAQIVSEARLNKPLTIRHHDRNRGKGAAVRTGLDTATGDLCLVFDADPEYSVGDIGRLVETFLQHEVDAVYGVRSFSGHSAFSFWYVVGNRVVTFAANVLYNSYIRDLESCLKLVPTSALRAMELESESFEIEPEITAKLLRAKARIFEIPISYSARTREEGKKLSGIDGLKALVTLVRYRFRPPIKGLRRAG